jgi:hypothetical protein
MSKLFGVVFVFGCQMSFSVIETFERDSTTDGTNFSKKMRSSKT